MVREENSVGLRHRGSLNFKVRHSAKHNCNYSEVSHTPKCEYIMHLELSFIFFTFHFLYIYTFSCSLSSNPKYNKYVLHGLDVLYIFILNDL